MSPANPRGGGGVARGGQGGRAAKAGSARKGANVGSGGQRRKALEGRKPTPRAEERTGHPAQRRAQAQSRAAGGSGSAGARPRGAVGRDRAEQPEVVAGRNPVVEALRAGVPATGLLIVGGIERDQRVTEALRLATDRGIPLIESTKSELDRLTERALHQGLGLSVPPYAYADPDDLLVRAADAGEPALIAGLDGVTDPRNLGAVIRSAAAFGAHGVLIPSRRAAGVSSGAWKASAGAAARLPVAQAGNLSQQLIAYADAGLTVVGLAADGEVTLDELDASDPLCVVVGSEDKGLSRLVAERCQFRLRIPMTSDVESLNAGIAMAVVLADIARRRTASLD